jgi:Flp pilus assembly secretin CpaC
MRRSLALLTFAAVTAATPALAATLTAPLGQAVRLPIRGVASDVVVGDTKIADVTVVGPSTIYVSGRGYGSTNVVVVDAGGRTLFDGRIVVPAANVGQVTLYRGSEQSLVMCTPNCSAPVSSSGKGGSNNGPTIRDMLTNAVANAMPSGGAPAPAGTAN